MVIVQHNRVFLADMVRHTHGSIWQYTNHDAPQLETAIPSALWNLAVMAVAAVSCASEPPTKRRRIDTACHSCASADDITPAASASTGGLRFPSQLQCTSVNQQRCLQLAAVSSCDPPSHHSQQVDCLKSATIDGEWKRTQAESHRPHKQHSRVTCAHPQPPPASHSIALVGTSCNQHAMQGQQHSSGHPDTLDEERRLTCGYKQPICHLQRHAKSDVRAVQQDQQRIAQPMESPMQQQRHRRVPSQQCAEYATGVVQCVAPKAGSGGKGSKPGAAAGGGGRMNGAGGGGGGWQGSGAAAAGSGSGVGQLHEAGDAADDAADDGDGDDDDQDDGAAGAGPAVQEAAEQLHVVSYFIPIVSLLEGHMLH